MPRTPRRPSPAVLIAIAALVVALGSTAVAATLITSSSQIKDGVILSRDVQDGTLQGADFQNDTISVGKLTRATRTSLRGQTGPKGDRGAQGPKGPSGDAILSSVSYAAVKVTVGPASFASVRAACPKGLVVVGGGVSEPSGKAVVASSGPSGPKAWISSLTNTDAVPHEVTVTAICTKAKRTA